MSQVAPTPAPTGDEPREAGAVVFEASGIGKTFGAFRALSDVSFTLRDGEVVGLIGENGAGKSTMLNIMCGALQPDDGELRLHGGPYAPRSYSEAMNAGVFRVYQEPAFVPTMSVTENMVLGFEKSFATAGLLQRRRIQRTAAETLEPLGDLVDPDQLMGSCDANTQQAVEILRALLASRVLGIERPIVLLDEPTAALAGDEVAILFRTLERLRGRATFVFVSHRLQEIQRECDRAYVLKDGRIVAEVDSSVPEAELHTLMVGRERADDYYLESTQRQPSAAVAVAATGLSGAGFADIDLQLHEGEILGVAGVVGSGKEELGKVLAGAAPRVAGTITIGGRTQHRDHTHERLRAGVGYVPRDRQTESVIAAFPLSWNLTLSTLTLGGCGTGPVISGRREHEASQRWIERLSVRTRSGASLMSSLSGGNQQKVVIGRVLEAGARVLVLDNPTRGIDAGAKSEIYGVLRGLADEGVAMVVISDDLPELIGLSNRLLVMRDGACTALIDAHPGAKPTEESLIAEMV